MRPMPHLKLIALAGFALFALLATTRAAATQAGQAGATVIQGPHDGTTARAASAPPVVDAPGAPRDPDATTLPSADGLEADTAGGQARDGRSDLAAMIAAFDAQAAQVETSAGSADEIAQAAAARAAFAKAAEAIDSLPEDEAVRIRSSLPIVTEWPALFKPPAMTAREPAPHDLAPNDQADLEALRTQWDAVFQRYQTWAPLVGDNQAEYLAWISDARTMLASLSYEDLAALQEAISYLPNWQDVYAPDLTALLAPGGGPLPVLSLTKPPMAVDGAAPKLPDAATAATAGAGGDATIQGTYVPNSVRPAIDAGDQCSDATLNYTYDNLVGKIIAEAVLRGVAIAITAGVEFAPKDIKVSILGFSVDIPNPYTFIAQLGKLVVNRVADGLSADLTVNAVCTSIIHWELTVIHAQSWIDRSQDIMAQELTHHNAMIQRFNALDLTERELWKLQLQLSIEENLLEDAPKADGSDENRIALFQWLDTICYDPEELLPAPQPTLTPPALPTLVSPLHDPPKNIPLPTVAAFVGPPDAREQCGLELVRRIVDETIQHNLLAGNNIHNAQSYLAAGDSLKAAHMYGAAYVRYRLAYQAAVKPDPEPTH